jgi:hypothetical protein
MKNKEIIATAIEQAGLETIYSCCRTEHKYCNSDRWQGNLERFANHLLCLAGNYFEFKFKLHQEVCVLDYDKLPKQHRAIVMARFIKEEYIDFKDDCKRLEQPILVAYYQLYFPDMPEMMRFPEFTERDMIAIEDLHKRKS